MNKKGQVTAFVIVAILIVAAIFVLVLVNRGDVSVRERDFDDPENYLSSCIKEKGEEVVKEMLKGGGFIGTNDTILYNSEKITYLCKNINNFEPCVNQYPLYVSQVEKEFEKHILNYAQQCFSSLKQELTDRNYDISESGNLNIEANLKPNVIEIVFRKEVTLSKSGDSRKFSRFDTYIPSKLFDIALVVNEIISQEAKWCYFSNDGFMTLYPEYDIRVRLLDENTKIYSVIVKETKDKLMMATRGCAMPAGLF